VTKEDFNPCRGKRDQSLAPVVPNKFQMREGLTRVSEAAGSRVNSRTTSVLESSHSRIACMNDEVARMGMISKTG